MIPGMEWQVANLELSKHLKELKVPQQQTEFSFDGHGRLHRKDYYEDFPGEFLCDAPSVPELGNKLPQTHESSLDFLQIFKNPEWQEYWIVQYGSFGDLPDSENFKPAIYFDGPRLVDVMARMYAHLIEKGIVKP